MIYRIKIMKQIKTNIVSNNEFSEAMTGVYLDKGIAVMTNSYGASLSRIRLVVDRDEEEPEWFEPIIIKKQAWDLAIKQKEPILVYNDELKIITVDTGSGYSMFELIEANYPPIYSVFKPFSECDYALALDPKLLFDVWLSMGSPSVIRMEVIGNTLQLFNNDAVGLIMQVKMENEGFEKGFWIDENIAGRAGFYEKDRQEESVPETVGIDDDAESIEEGEYEPLQEEYEYEES